MSLHFRPSMATLSLSVNVIRGPLVHNRPLQDGITFRNCLAPSPRYRGGGCIYIDGTPDFTVRNSVFESASALSPLIPPPPGQASTSGLGGAVYATRADRLTIANCSFTANSAIAVRVGMIGMGKGRG